MLIDIVLMYYANINNNNYNKTKTLWDQFYNENK